MKADRLLSILLLLQARGQVTAVELSRRLEVTERTIRRDIDSLGAAGVPVVAVRGRAGGYALIDGFRTDATGLTGDEARALFLFAGGAASDLGLGDSLDRALRKLLAALPEDRRDIAHDAQARLLVDPQGWQAAPSASPSLEIVRTAVLGDRRLRLTYRSAGAAEAREFDVDPYGLVLAAGVWYLIAARVEHDAVGSEPRTYRISRIVRAAVLDEPAARPADLDLAALWSRMRGRMMPARDELDEVIVRVRSGMLGTLERLQGASISAIEPVGADPAWRTVRLRYPGAEAARGALLGFAAALEVVEPPELRAEMARAAADVIALYEPGSGQGAPQ